MTTPIDPTRQELLTRSQGIVALTCLGLDHGQLAAASPCEGWTVADVVSHLAGGAVMAAELLDGRSGAEALATRERWSALQVDGGMDLRSVGGALARERRRFATCGADDTVQHPAMPMTATSLLDQRILEYVVHTWDIRRAVGDGPASDDAAVDAALTALRPLASIVAQLGVFGPGPSGALAPGATPLDELLDLAGRRP